MSDDKFFKDDYAVCQKQFFSMYWDCRCGFDNFEDANNYLHQLDSQFNNRKIIPVKQFWPTPIKREIIKKILTPHIVLRNKGQSGL